MTQKVTRELDQIVKEDDAEGIEDVEYASIELVQVPDSDIIQRMLWRLFRRMYYRMLLRKIKFSQK